MKTVLVTGFEPFGGDAANPSQEIALALDGRVLAGRRVAGGVLPCVFGASAVELKRLLRVHRPELVVCLGLAAGRAELTPERVAINVDDARIADNAGARPVDRAVVRGGPAAYFSTLPIKAMTAALREAGVPAAVSQTAGTFVCNHVFYALLHALRRWRGVRGGFVHVPAPSRELPVAAMTAALARAIETALRTQRDVRVGGGRIA